MPFIEVAQVSDLPTNAMKSYSVGDKQVLLSDIDGKFYAIDNICTHAGGELSKGKLDGKIATCPRHGSKFDVSSGECLSGPKIGIFKLKGKSIKVYEVKVEGNSIKVNI